MAKRRCTERRTKAYRRWSNTLPTVERRLKFGTARISTAGPRSPLQRVIGSGTSNLRSKRLRRYSKSCAMPECRLQENNADGRSCHSRENHQPKRFIGAIDAFRTDVNGFRTAVAG